MDEHAAPALEAACSPEVFARVWQRVMPEAREGCPVEPCAAAPREQTQEQTPRSTQAQLCRLAGECRDRARIYRALSQRLGGRAGQALCSMAQALERWQKALTAAYFLMTGSRCPASPLAPMPREDSAALLRRQFLWERERQALCRACAGEDELLSPVLEQGDLEGEQNAHTILRLLEGMGV